MAGQTRTPTRIQCHHFGLRIFGIALATAASIGLSSVMNIPYLFNPAINLLSFAISAGIGVVFGFFPARRAAQLDPIDALRHE